MAEQLDNSVYAGIAGAKPMDSRGNNFRLGRHLCRIKGFKISKSQKKRNSIYCAVECQIVKTLNTNSRGDKLTREEEAAGIALFSQDTPHLTGESCTAIYNQDTHTDLFDQNCSAAMAAMKLGAFNWVAALQKGSDDSAEDKAYVAKETARFTSKGIDLSPEQRNNRTPVEVQAAAGDAQAFRGVYVIANVNRIETVGKKIRMNATTFEAVPPEMFAQILAEMDDAE